MYVYEALFRACARSWPERPKVDPAEWPFTQDGLEDAITQHMELVTELHETL